MDGSPGVQIVKISMDLECDEVYDVLMTHDSTHETIKQWLDKIQVDQEIIVGGHSISPEAISQDKVGKESQLVEPCEKEILETMRNQSTAVCCALNQAGTKQPLTRKIPLRSYLQKPGAN